MSKTNSTRVVKSVKDNKVSVARIFTDRVIARIKSENRLPWTSGFFRPENMPFNVISGKPYRGLNRYSLPAGGYLTYKQCTDLGGTVKKGSHAQIVVFWKFSKFGVTNDDGDIIDEKTIPFMRYYSVFSVNDCDIPADKLEKLYKKAENDGVEYKDAANVADFYLTREKIALLPMGQFDDCPCYRPGADTISMPEKDSFKSTARYYQVLFHEMTHSTGAKKRLNRLHAEAHFGSRDYSKEELVAELGSAQLAAITNLELDEIEDTNVAYLQSWLSALQNDEKLLISANSQAQKAVDFIIDGFDDWTPDPAEIAEIEEEVTEIVTETVEPEPAPATEPEDAPLPLDEAVKRLRALLKAGVITMDEFTDMVVCLQNREEDGADDTAPFVPAEPEYDGSYSFRKEQDDLGIGLWYELIHFVIHRKADAIGFFFSYDNGVGEGDDSEYHFSNVIDDTDHIAGLLPAPKSGDADQTYKYYCVRRPYDIGTVPADGIVDFERDPEFTTDYNFPIKLSPHDAVIYNRELTIAEVEEYELTPAYDMTGLWTEIFAAKDELRGNIILKNDLAKQVKTFAKQNEWFWDFARSILKPLRMFTLDTLDWIAVYMAVAPFDDGISSPVCKMDGKSELWYGDKKQTDFREIRFNGTNWIFGNWHIADFCVKCWDNKDGKWIAHLLNKKDNPKTVIKKALVKEITKTQQNQYFSFTKDGRCIYSDGYQMWITDFKPANGWTCNERILEVYEQYCEAQNLIEVTSEKMAVFVNDYGYYEPCVCLSADGVERFIPANTYKTFGPECRYYINGQTVIVKHNGMIVGVVMQLHNKYYKTILEN